ncbi:SRPBCC domain-containing protein [Microbacterium deminutum]|uniref:SRPBCC domain-containing protein n=1 Tax=Microbacterium deminutum TaxID=344164 RepID=A0ABP5CVG3_9MICO
MTGSTAITREALGLTLSRTFDAPRERVFRALSLESELMRWWGPPSYPVVACTVDFRPGGIWHYCLRGPAGDEVWARAVYRDIREPALVSYDETSSDAAGTVTTDRPGAFVTIRLSPAPDGGTRFEARLQYTDASDRDRAVRYGVERGFSAALGLLENHLRMTTTAS